MTKEFHRLRPYYSAELQVLLPRLRNAKKTFTETMQNLLSYVQTFHKDLGMRIIAMHIKDIIYGLKSSQILALSSRATYVSYI